jgi:hypothetical protein
MALVIQYAHMKHTTHMTLEQIKSAVTSGQVVYWENPMYRVVCDQLGQWLIKCGPSAIGLTWADGVTLNGKPEQFHILDN